VVLCGDVSCWVNWVTLSSACVALELVGSVVLGFVCERGGLANFLWQLSLCCFLVG